MSKQKNKKEAPASKTKKISAYQQEVAKAKAIKKRKR